MAWDFLKRVSACRLCSCIGSMFDVVSMLMHVIWTLVDGCAGLRVSAARIIIIIIRVRKVCPRIACPISSGADFCSACGQVERPPAH